MYALCCRALQKYDPESKQHSFQTLCMELTAEKRKETDHTCTYIPDTAVYHSFLSFPFHSSPKKQKNPSPAVALTQISAYSTQNNLAVLKVMEAMHIAYAKKNTGLAGLSMSWTKHATEHTRKIHGRKARIVCEEHFISLNMKGAFQMRYSFLYLFSLVRNFRIFVCILVHLRTMFTSPRS